MNWLTLLIDTISMQYNPIPISNFLFFYLGVPNNFLSFILNLIITQVYTCNVNQKLNVSQQKSGNYGNMVFSRNFSD